MKYTCQKRILRTQKTNISDEHMYRNMMIELVSNVDLDELKKIFRMIKREPDQKIRPEFVGPESTKYSHLYATNEIEYEVQLIIKD